MMTTVTHHEHHTTTERVLFMACELSENTWKLGFTTGHGHKPHERTVAAPHQARVLQEIAQATRRFGLPETAPVVRCDEAGREGFWAASLCTSARDHQLGGGFLRHCS